MSSNTITLTQMESKPQSEQKKPFVMPSYAERVSLRDRLHNMFFHVERDGSFSFRFGYNWSWPVKDRTREYPEGFDSHQTCNDLGVERFYNFETMTPGPIYRYRPTHVNQRSA